MIRMMCMGLSGAGCKISSEGMFSAMKDSKYDQKSFLWDDEKLCKVYSKEFRNTFNIISQKNQQTFSENIR